MIDFFFHLWLGFLLGFTATGGFKQTPKQTPEQTQKPQRETRAERSRRERLSVEHSVRVP